MEDAGFLIDHDICRQHFKGRAARPLEGTRPSVELNHGVGALRKGAAATDLYPPAEGNPLMFLLAPLSPMRASLRDRQNDNAWLRTANTKQRGAASLSAIDQCKRFAGGFHQIQAVSNLGLALGGLDRSNAASVFKAHSRAH